MAMKSHCHLDKHTILSAFMNKYVIFVQECLGAYKLMETCTNICGSHKQTASVNECVVDCSRGIMSFVMCLVMTY